MDSRAYVEQAVPRSGVGYPSAVEQAAGKKLIGSPLTRECPPGAVQHILLVEDEAFVRRVTAEVLESVGYRVPVAGNAAEALEACRRGLDPVNLLLTDVVLPGKNGRDLANEFSVLYPGISVLLISGYAEQIAWSALAGEGHEWLAKPFSSQALLIKVRQLLHGASRRTGT